MRRFRRCRQGRLKGLTSSTSGTEKAILKNQFYQALADSMKMRLLPEQEKRLANAVDFLNSSTLPQEMSPEYGESEVKLLCNLFLLPFSEIKTAYREFKDSNGLLVPPALRKLINYVDTIPVSTAACERGFSKMNL